MSKAAAAAFFNLIGISVETAKEKTLDLSRVFKSGA